jgi:hypothetical protein
MTALALDDAETLKILVAMDEWHAAYPLAIAEARRACTVAAWGRVLNAAGARLNF